MTVHDRSKQAGRAPARGASGEANARLILPDNRALLFPASFASPGPHDPRAVRAYADDDAIAAPAGAVKRSLERRLSADGSMMTGLLRLFVAAVWLTAGLFFLRSTGAGAMDPDHAAGLARVFFSSGAAAAIAAVALIGFVAIRVRVLESDLEEASKRFGESVAVRLADYDRRLASAEDATSLSALAEAERDARRAGEIAADLRTFGGASIEDHQAAAVAGKAYGAFLDAATAPQPDAQTARPRMTGWTAAIFFIAALFLVASLIAIVTGFAIPTGDGAAGGDAGLAKYPAPIAAIVIGAVAFLSAGAAPGALSADVATGRRRAHLAMSLAAFRSAASEAPQTPVVADVARRADQTRSALEGRLRQDREPTAAPQRRDLRAPGGTPISGNPAASGPAGNDRWTSLENDDDHERDHPAWRRREEGPRFVGARFEAAPKPWRTDAYAARFAADEGDAPGAKRGFFTARKRPSN